MVEQQPLTIEPPVTPPISGHDVVMPSWLPWDGVPLVMHKTARRLVQCGNRVLYCNPPYALSTIKLHPQHAERIKGDLRRWWGGARRVAPDLYVWTPPPLAFQTGLSRLNDAANHALLRRALARMVRRLGFTRPLVWSYHPFYLDDEAFLNPRALIFDCNDRIAAFEPRQEKRKLLDPLEAALLRRADLVFVTARTLQEDLGPIRPDLIYAPSGVDAEVVRRAAAADLDVPADLAAIPAPRIGYLGVVNTRIDWELIRTLADARPAWQVVMVGPELEATPPEVRELPNLHFLGGKEPHELAGYLAGFDVGLIPFRPARFVRYMFPTKTYEYLAAGIPTVSTEIPALADLRPLVRVAGDYEAFIRGVEEALEETGEIAEELRQKRVAEALRNTWDARFARTEALVAQVLKAQGSPADLSGACQGGLLPQEPPQADADQAIDGLQPSRRHGRLDVLGIGVDPFPLREVLDRVVSFVRKDEKRLILYSNVHVANTGYQAPGLRAIINDADLVYVDGSGIRVAAAMLGGWLPARMTGADWIHDLCARAVTEELSLFLLAGRPGIAGRAKKKLEDDHPGLKVAGTHHGYLVGDAEANEEALSEIDRTRPDIVIVGMGTPTQEEWIHAHFDRIEAPVVWGVGALFDFVTGEVKRGPRWMLDSHLEWAARLWVEPKRLWRRYLVGNALFLGRVFLQRLRRSPKS